MPAIVQKVSETGDVVISISPTDRQQIYSLSQDDHPEHYMLCSTIGVEIDFSNYVDPLTTGHTVAERQFRRSLSETISKAELMQRALVRMRIRSNHPLRSTMDFALNMLRLRWPCALRTLQIHFIFEDRDGTDYDFLKQFQDMMESRAFRDGLVSSLESRNIDSGETIARFPLLSELMVKFTVGVYVAYKISYGNALKTRAGETQATALLQHINRKVQTQLEVVQRHFDQRNIYKNLKFTAETQFSRPKQDEFHLFRMMNRQ